MAKTKKQITELDALHPLGIGGLFEVYGGWKFILKPSFYVGFVASLVLFFILLFSSRNANSILDLIKKTNDIGMDLDGGLIGLTLAGLTLIVTFGSDKLLQQLVKSNINKALSEKRPLGFSSYQTSVSKFGFAVFVQILTLIILFVFSFVIELKMVLFEESLNKFFNCLFLSIEVFLVIYSLFLVVQMTVNIFTISQMNHSVYFSDITKELLDNLREEEERQVKGNEQAGSEK